MAQDILVLGAGMIGTCAALELQLRGHHVVLVDRRPPGEEASYGNAGLIQGEAVQPYAMPRDWRTLLGVAFKQRLDVNYHVGGVMASRLGLALYWRASAPASHAAIAREYSQLIGHAASEHDRMLTLAGAQDLVRREGLRFVFRAQQALDGFAAHAQQLQRDYGVRSSVLDAAALSAAEPAFLHASIAGAVHWTDSWNSTNPGELVKRYARLFEQRGGRLLSGDADSLRKAGSSWEVQTTEGPVQAQHAVLATGVWASDFTRRLGYRWPLFAKRGYHRHYVGGASLNVPALDAEVGYVMSPQQRGLRITSGAELARIDAKPTPRQLIGAEAKARELLDLGRAVETQVWMGSRPCSGDMKPLIGAAPKHAGLWINCGHGHHGFTLGPASARLLADLIEGGDPYTAADPFAPARFER